MDRKPQPYRRMLCRDPWRHGAVSSSPSYLWADRKKSSFPCSLIREPILPGCFFQVCVSALLLLPTPQHLMNELTCSTPKLLCFPVGGAGCVLIELLPVSLKFLPNPRRLRSKW